MTVPAPDVAMVVGKALTDKETSKFLTKLLDTVGNGVGLVYEPTAIRRRAKAEAEAAITKAKADAEIARIEAQTEYDVEVTRIEGRALVRQARDRAKVRFDHQEEFRQKNLESVVAKAALMKPETVSDEPIDQDWVAQFVENSKDISNEDMQTIWARILAREVAKPGSFSLRTMAFVRTMSKNDADTSTRFCSTIWTLDGERTSMNFQLSHERALPDTPVNSDDLLKLDMIGLITLNLTSIFDAPLTNGRTIILEYFGDKYNIRIKGEVSMRRFHLGKTVLTGIGHELVPIAGAVPHEGYKNDILKRLTNSGYEVSPE